MLVTRQTLVGKQQRVPNMSILTPGVSVEGQNLHPADKPSWYFTSASIDLMNYKQVFSILITTSHAVVCSGQLYSSYESICKVYCVLVDD